MNITKRPSRRYVTSTLPSCPLSVPRLIFCKGAHVHNLPINLLRNSMPGVPFAGHCYYSLRPPFCGPRSRQSLVLSFSCAAFCIPYICQVLFLTQKQVEEGARGEEYLFACTRYFDYRSFSNFVSFIVLLCFTISFIVVAYPF